MRESGEDSVSEQVTFLATIPPLQSALTFAGDGGGRIRLEFDDTQTEATLRLLELRGMLIRVTVQRAK